MFRFPNAVHRMPYYTVLVMDLCTELPALVPPILGKVFPLLYDALTPYDADVALYRRLREWFVHHLSNFGLKWKWKELETLVDEHSAEAASKKQFFKDVLAHLTRLAYVKNVEQTIGPILSALLPPPPAPQFIFGETNAIISGNPILFLERRNKLVADKNSTDEKVIEVAGKVLLQLAEEGGPDQQQQRMTTAQNMLSEVKEIVISPPETWSQTMKVSAHAGATLALDEEKETKNWLERAILTETVLNLGRKTFTHFARTIERYLFSFSA